MKKKIFVVLSVLVISLLVFGVAQAALYSAVTTKTWVFQSGGQDVFKLTYKTKFKFNNPGGWAACDSAWQIKTQLKSGWWLADGGSPPRCENELYPPGQGVVASSGGYILKHDGVPVVIAVATMTADNINGVLYWSGSLDLEPTGQVQIDETESYIEYE